MHSTSAPWITTTQWSNKTKYRNTWSTYTWQYHNLNTFFWLWIKTGWQHAEVDEKTGQVFAVTWATPQALQMWVSLELNSGCEVLLFLCLVKSNKCSLQWPVSAHLLFTGTFTNILPSLSSVYCRRKASSVRKARAQNFSKRPLDYIEMLTKTFAFFEIFGQILWITRKRVSECEII